MSYQFFRVISSVWISLGCWTIVSESLTPTTATAAPVTKKAGNRLTVADYFLQIPAKYLQDPGRDRITPVTPRQRQQLLSAAQKGGFSRVYDINNGYLELSVGGDTCGKYTIAIFKRSGTSPLVARNIACTVGDSLVILDPAQNWQDITAQVLTADLSPSPELKYTVDIVLPRRGKTIEVARSDENNRQTSLGRYRFNGQRFIKE